LNEDILVLEHAEEMAPNTKAPVKERESLSPLPLNKCCRLILAAYPTANVTLERRERRKGREGHFLSLSRWRRGDRGGGGGGGRGPGVLLLLPASMHLIDQVVLPCKLGYLLTYSMNKYLI
jgi:hypothetical protein